MSEYRHNLITDRWVIIAAERGKRPSDFKKQPADNPQAFQSGCPFCSGNEQMTPPEVFAIRPDHSRPDTSGWLVRVVPNKYPAVGRDSVNIESLEPYLAEPGRGIHEVIIESPHHEQSLAGHGREQAKRIFTTLRDRYRIHSHNSMVSTICLFNNHGGSAGASLMHPHFQLITLNVLPPRLVAQLEYCRNYYAEHDRNVFGAMIEFETSIGERIIARNDSFIAVCPFASMCPFEVYILPRITQPQFGDLTDTMADDLAAIAKIILSRLETGLGNPDYNMVVHTAPTSEEENYFCWYIQIYPRLSTAGGFELGTDIYINTVAPNLAAAFYRGENNEN
jgi:UDPglucose--hexose-1-phosphate uridylyltransferase